jgi:transposase-like protein
MAKDNPEDNKNKGPEPLPLEHKKVSNPFGQNGKKRRLFNKAMEMYENQYTFKTISQECGVHVSTLRRWFRGAGAPPKKSKWEENPTPWIDKDAPKPESIFDGTEAHKTPDALKKAAEHAHLQEKGRINEIASSQSSPAEQYQSYMASNAVKLMRDGLKGMRPPSNVREMEVLDKIARRHFGLDEKQSGGANSLSIDINILNDAAAASRKRPTKVVDVDPNPKDNKD